MIPTTWLYRILAAAFAAAALLWLVQSRDHWRVRAHSSEQLYRAEQAAHAATVAGYRAAAEQARREDAANVARVKAEQAAINERTENDYEIRIAAARARAGELRREGAGAPTHPGTVGSTSVPGIPAAAARAAEAAGEDRFSGADRLIATEQAIQLDELVKWVRSQAAISPRAATTGPVHPRQP